MVAKFKRIFNSTEPLGLPKGSVRGLLALGLVAPVFINEVNGRPTSEGILALAGAVIAFYFKERADERQAAAQQADVPQDG
jgi:hypothetical protein